MSGRPDQWSTGAPAPGLLAHPCFRLDALLANAAVLVEVVNGNLMATPLAALPPVDVGNHAELLFLGASQWIAGFCGFDDVADCRSRLPPLALREGENGVVKPLELGAVG